MIILMDLKSKESPGLAWNHDMDIHGPHKGVVPGPGTFADHPTGSFSKNCWGLRKSCIICILYTVFIDDSIKLQFIYVL